MTIPNDRARWLKGKDANCDKENSLPKRPYRMVLLGAPGTGKGTQAELLCEALGTCHLSTGDVFRAARGLDGNLSPAMQQAMAAMQRGELVPDETVIELVRERIACLQCDYGFLLDGFPRTVAQAEALNGILQQAGITLDAVLNYELPVETVVERLSGRRTCRNCKTTFHVRYKPPAVEGVCDKCHGELFQREDDRPESIRVRLDAYERSTAPLIVFYQHSGLLIPLSADGTPDEVFARTMAALRDRVVA